MKRITFARLAVLMLAVAGLALAGCGGDDNGNGGVSPATVEQLQDAVDAVDTKADAAQDAADAAQETADEAKAQEPPPGASLDAIWEALAGKAIEDALAAEVGPGPKSFTELTAAIIKVAKKYGVSDESALAFLASTFPIHETIQADDVEDFLMKLHAAGHLAATRDAAAMVLTGPQGEPGDETTVLANAWEEIAGKAIADDLKMRVGTGPKTVTQLRAAIRATAVKFGLDAAAVTEAIAFVDARFPTAEEIQADDVAKALMDLHAANHLPANRNAAVYVVDMGDDMMAEEPTKEPTKEPGEPEPMGLAAILADEDAVTDGMNASRDASDFSLPSDTKFTSEGGGIESFDVRVPGGFGDYDDNTYKTMGLWADGVAGFVTLSGTPGTSAGFKIYTATVGVPADDVPMGREGTASWNGQFTGIHKGEPGAAFDPVGNTEGVVMLNKPVEGDVKLTVTFNEDGEGTMLRAAFDNFVTRDKTHVHAFDMVDVTRRGFDDEVVVAADTLAGKIDGRFYEAGDGLNAGGTMTLQNGAFDDAMYVSSTAAADAISTTLDADASPTISTASSSPPTNP